MRHTQRELTSGDGYEVNRVARGTCSAPPRADALRRTLCALLEITITPMYIPVEVARLEAGATKNQYRTFYA